MTGDSGSVANWFARDIKIRRGVNPALTIQTIAVRTAERISQLARAGEL
ncbi:MAG: hypothetical protein ABI845_05610 [Polaromonas sp.]